MRAVGELMIWKVWAIAGLLASASGCSVLVGFKDECTRNEDCASKGAGLVCMSNLCVSDESMNTQDAGVDCSAWNPATGECFPCAAQNQLQLLNACTGSMCVPFDESRVTKIMDGSFPAVPDLPDAGVGGAG